MAQSEEKGRRYNLLALNGFQEPVFIGSYERVEELLLALLAALAEYRTLIVEVAGGG